MKKLLFAVLTVAAIAACNSPQEITSPAVDSSTMMTTPADTVATTPMDTTMGGDTMKRDTLRR